MRLSVDPGATSQQLFPFASCGGELDIHRLVAPEIHKSLLAPGLAVTGGILAAGGGYAMVQSIWNAAEKRRRQALVDEAQQETIAAADLEASKSAAAAPPAQDPKLNLSDMLTAAPVALPLLTALATGGLTYAALNKSFPVVTKKKHVGPKRIRVVGEDTTTPYDLPAGEEEETEKVASAFQVQDLQDAGDEFLASFVDASRPGTITGDFIRKAASGQLTAMEELYKAAGIDALVASLKGASDLDPGSEAKALGTMALFKSAALSDTVRAIAAAEYIESYGPLYSEIVGDDTHMRKMASIGCLMGVIARDSALPELAKQAAMMPPVENPSSHGILARLKELLSGVLTPGPAATGEQPAAPGAAAPQGGSHHEREERDAALTSDAGGGVGGVVEDGSDGHGASSESTGDDDVIDGIMASDKPGDILTPTG